MVLPIFKVILGSMQWFCKWLGWIKLGYLKKGDEMRSWAMAVLVLFFTSGFAYADDVDLFILAGQSNAQGWAGDAAQYPPDPGHLDQNILFYWDNPGRSSSQGAWTNLQAQGGIFPHGHFGPEVTFARALRAAGYHPAIFKYSQGSTSLATEWGWPGKGMMYDQMVQELREAITQLQQAGDTVRIRGFVWIQGESDANSAESAHAYKARLKAVLNDMRTRVANDPNLPVVLGVDEQHPMVEMFPEVVQAQQALARENRHMVFTSMIGLEKADVTHLTPRGLVAHGQRLFEAYRRVN